MQNLGLRAEAFTGILLEILDKTQAGAQMACHAAIAAQSEIAFGGIADPHHGLCWRVNEFQKKFNTGTDILSQLLKSE